MRFLTMPTLALILSLAVAPASRADQNATPQYGAAQDPAPAEAAPQEAFGETFRAYEAIRLSLLDDHRKGVEEQAARIREILEALAEDYSAEAAGVDPDHAEALEKLLPRMRGLAQLVGKAESLEETREQYYLLSKLLVRWREWLAGGDRPVVVFCSMAGKSWLQEGDRPIGNPYHGQEMPRCGQIVSKD